MAIATNEGRMTFTPVPENRYRAEWLPNGLVRIEDRRSGLVSCYTVEGQHHSGIAVPAQIRHNLGMDTEGLLRVESGLYLCPDGKSGDNSDNGHFTIDLGSHSQ